MKPLMKILLILAVALAITNGKPREMYPEAKPVEIKMDRTGR